jgi:hypothetical protein
LLKQLFSLALLFLLEIDHVGMRLRRFLARDLPNVRDDRRASARAAMAGLR